ncbi:hypothetical protein CYMTET_42816 [Cymbomonas tetramitiformis]|uniref:Uncharacterized protein n=1 Tax=Cymbomonas tetramitiformis TaxID=36881 RepID=A0AAE0C3F5_9CHLO|nr:hypothetical protein CYMTET_42816 [Cymbomonas tetramitiformis]
MAPSEAVSLPDVALANNRFDYYTLQATAVSGTEATSSLLLVTVESVQSMALMASKTKIYMQSDAEAEKFQKGCKQCSVLMPIGPAVKGTSRMITYIAVKAEYRATTYTITARAVDSQCGWRPDCTSCAAAPSSIGCVWCPDAWGNGGCMSATEAASSALQCEAAGSCSDVANVCSSYSASSTSVEGAAASCTQCIASSESRACNWCGYGDDGACTSAYQAQGGYCQEWLTGIPGRLPSATQTCSERMAKSTCESAKDCVSCGERAAGSGCGWCEGSNGQGACMPAVLGTRALQCAQSSHWGVASDACPETSVPMHTLGLNSQVSVDLQSGSLGAIFTVLAYDTPTNVVLRTAASPVGISPSAECPLTIRSLQSAILGSTTDPLAVAKPPLTSLASGVWPDSEEALPKAMYYSASIASSASPLLTSCRVEVSTEELPSRIGVAGREAVSVSETVCCGARLMYKVQPASLMYPLMNVTIAVANVTGGASAIVCRAGCDSDTQEAVAVPAGGLTSFQLEIESSPWYVGVSAEAQEGVGFTITAYMMNDPTVQNNVNLDEKDDADEKSDDIPAYMYVLYSMGAGCILGLVSLILICGVRKINKARRRARYATERTKENLRQEFQPDSGHSEDPEQQMLAQSRIRHGPAIGAFSTDFPAGMTGERCAADDLTASYPGVNKSKTPMRSLRHLYGGGTPSKDTSWLHPDGDSITSAQGLEMQKALGQNEGGVGLDGELIGAAGGMSTPLAGSGDNVMQVLNERMRILAQAEEDRDKRLDAELLNPLPADSPVAPRERPDEPPANLDNEVGVEDLDEAGSISHVPPRVEMGRSLSNLQIPPKPPLFPSGGTAVTESVNRVTTPSPGGLPTPSPGGPLAVSSRATMMASPPPGAGSTLSSPVPKASSGSASSSPVPKIPPPPEQSPRAQPSTTEDILSFD